MAQYPNIESISKQYRVYDFGQFGGPGNGTNAISTNKKNRTNGSQNNASHNGDDCLHSG